MAPPYGSLQAYQEVFATERSVTAGDPWLDAIERAAIRDKYLPLDVLRLMVLCLLQVALPQLTAWVERFFLINSSITCIVLMAWLW